VTELDEEPLYTDDNGVPMLFDVVIPGDYVKAAGVLLASHKAKAAAPSPEEIEARIQSAIDAALPAATEKAAALLRDSLLQELHQALNDDAQGG
jgi:hypothetical protein